jgi:hypothetical protein
MTARRLSLLLILLLVLPACSLLGGGEPDDYDYEDDEEQTDSGLIPSDVTRDEFVPCPSLADPSITHMEVLQAPSLPEPDPGVAYVDPVFGTCVVRVTDRRADPSSDDDSRGMKNEYSRVQSFNADGSRLLVRGIEGTFYLYDAETLTPIGLLPIEVEPRWDAENPDLLHYTDETALMSYNVATGERLQVHDFAEDFPDLSLSAVWTRYEGSPSLDSRYWGLLAQDDEWEVVAYVVYDMQTNQVTTRRLPRGAEIDAVTISPLGTYFLAYYDVHCQEGRLGDDQNPCGLMVYDQNLENGRSLLRIIGHSDTVLDAQGREVLVYQEIDTDHISMLDLASGEVTDLWPIDFSHTPIGLHFSGRAFDVPGWVLVSTYGDDERSYTWMDNSVFAVELKAGGRVVRLAHTHALVDENQEHDYWAEPHASANQDFTRIVFTSNWGRSGTEQVEMYMIELPEGWMDRLP